MKSRLQVLACLSASFLLSSCQPGDAGSNRVYFDPIRYRLTAEVETPQGLRSGSSVIQTVWDRGLSGATVTGEAVAVDLPNGRTMFVLLRTESNVDWAGGVPGVAPPHDPTPPPLTADEREARVGRQVQWILADRAIHYLWGGDVSRMRAPYLPYMVTFRDISDPKTIERIDPTDLAKTFGSGYALKSLTVRVTDAPVTLGISKRLGWLPVVYQRVDRSFQPNGIPVGDFQRLFSTEIGK